jgi:hypothetical protein
MGANIDNYFIGSQIQAAHLIWLQVVHPFCQIALGPSPHALQYHTIMPPYATIASEEEAFNTEFECLPMLEVCDRISLCRLVSTLTALLKRALYTVLQISSFLVVHDSMVETL